MNEVKNIRVYEPRSYSQAGERRMPRIHFSYNSPPQQYYLSAQVFRPRPEPVAEVPIQEFKTHIYLQQKPFPQILQGLLSKKDSKTSKRRKKIFDYHDASMLRDHHSLEDSKENSREKQKTKSAIEYSNQKKKGVRRGIFDGYGGYDPKKNMNVSYNVQDQDGNRHFPIPKPAHPKSLVHYVDMAAYRKKKFFDEIPFFEKHEVFEIQKNQYSLQDDSEIQVGGIKRCESEITDGNNLGDFDFNLVENPGKQVVTSVQNLNDFDSGTRFFDGNNDEISNISNKQSFIDIKFAGSTNFSQFRKPFLQAPTASVHKWEPKLGNISQSKSQAKDETKSYIKVERQDSPIEYRQHTFEEKQHIVQRTIQKKNILPLGIICLGLLLFLIQIIK